MRLVHLAVLYFLHSPAHLQVRMLKLFSFKQSEGFDKQGQWKIRGLQGG